MRPLFQRSTIIGYPIFASVSGALGYYLEDMGTRQAAILEERKAQLLAKRARQQKRETSEAGEGRTYL
jgi:hypothetical protein